jgi:hypothetical protein
VRFSDWAEALRGVLGGGSARQPRLVVLDEFTYLLAHSPELASVLQLLFDEARSSRQPAARVILCGSALSVMSELLSGTQALRGRVSLEIVLREFDFRQARSFWKARSDDMALLVHATLGGTPGYRALLGGGAPRSSAAFLSWLGRGVLNPSHALFREADYLLTEDPRLLDRALYHSVLASISLGDSTPTRIGARLGRNEAALRHPLALLESAGFVRRAQDVLRSRRPVLTVADPIVRFHHVVVRPHLALLEERRFAEAWARARDAFSSQIVGPHFEELARAWVSRFASERTLGGAIGSVGTTGVNDAAGRTQIEVDVVAVAADARAQRPRLRLIGEAKASVRPRTVADLGRLERAAELLAATDRAEVTGARLALFGRGGFDRELVALARRRGDVVLVDLERLYGGD